MAEDEEGDARGVENSARHQPGKGLRRPLGRVGLPRDTVPIVVWLCSDESEYVTGETITADGGWIHTHWLGGVDLNLAAYRAKPKAT